MIEFYDMLKRKKLDLDNIADTVYGSEPYKLIDTIRELCFELMYKNKDLVRTDSSLFNFVANENLSGGSNSCAEINCRIERISELCDFAVLYSDKVLIINPLEKYVDYPLFDEVNNYVRDMIIYDLLIIWRIKPLVVEGIIGFVQTVHHFCKDCFRKLSSNEYINYEDRLQVATKMLERKISDSVDVYIVNEKDSFFIEFVGPEDIVEHEKSYLHFTNNIPERFIKYTTEYKKYKVKKEEYEELGIFDKFNYEIVDDFAIQDWYTKNFDYTYLTNRSIDIEIINSINKNEYKKQNQSLVSGLKHLVPVCNNVPLSKMVKFRNNNNELFDEYRLNIHKLLKDIKPNSESEYKEAFCDTIKPGVDKINKELKSYRKNLLNDLRIEILISAGLVTIGLQSGILPNNIADIIATIGGVGGVTTSVKKGVDILRKPNSVRNNPYYFLWKLNKKYN